MAGLSLGMTVNYLNIKVNWIYSLSQGIWHSKGEEFIGDKKQIKTDNKQLLKAKPKIKSINIVF